MCLVKLWFFPILLVYFSQKNYIVFKKKFITIIYIALNLIMLIDITDQIINSLISFIPIMCVGYNSNFREFS